MRWLGVAVLACPWLGACNASAFLCQSDEQCQDGASSGRCEPDGYCSFEDEDCPSGRRYGSLAPAGVAETCVDPDGTSGAETGIEVGTAQPVTSLDTGLPPSGTVSTSSEPTSTTDDTSDSDALDVPDAPCGNGSIDVGETCDDGNVVNDDGCNDDCRVPGTEYFFVTWDEAADERCYDLDGENDGTFAIAGFVTDSDGWQRAAMREYDLAGEEQWTYQHDAETSGWGVARRDDGSYLLGGASAAAGMTEQPLLVTVKDGAAIWSEELGFEGIVHGVDATEDDRLYVVGEAGDDASDTRHAFVAEIDADDLSLLWTTPYEATSSGSFWDVRFSDIGLFAVGYTLDGMLNDVAVLARFDLDGVLQGDVVFTSPGAGRTGFWRVSPSGSDVYLAGTKATPGSAWQAWFGRYDTTTESETLQTSGGDGNDEAFDIAVDAEGNVYVAGFLVEASQDAWVAKFAPGEQDPTWTWLYNGSAGGTDRAWALELADDGSVLVCGYSTEVGSEVDTYVTRLAH